MTTYTMISKSGETVELYSDDTFTLAFGSPETESEESTPELLANCFSRDDLMRLRAEVGEFSQEGEKITAALGGNQKMKNEKTLPENVIAYWDAEDWDDERMVATSYRYEDADTREPVEITEAEAARYAWGTCCDNLTGGSQSGELRES